MPQPLPAAVAIVKAQPQFESPWKLAEEDGAPALLAAANAPSPAGAAIVSERARRGARGEVCGDACPPRGWACWRLAGGARSSWLLWAKKQTCGRARAEVPGERPAVEVE